MANRKCVVILRGGLGNQLMQLAGGLHLASKSSRKLLLYSGLLPPVERSGPDGLLVRPLAVESFLAELKLSDEESAPEILRRSCVIRVISALYGRLNKRATVKLARRGLVSDPSGILSEEHCLQLSLTSHETILFDSFLFFPEVFRGLGDRIREAMASSLGDLSLNATMTESTVNAGIHIRLGDYKNLASGAHIPSEQYYLDAINEVSDRFDKVHFTLFSDQPELVPQAVKDLCAETCQDQDPISSLLKLANSDVIVGSNSTFSYAAHWLSGGGNLLLLPESDQLLSGSLLSLGRQHNVEFITC